MKLSPLFNRVVLLFTNTLVSVQLLFAQPKDVVKVVHPQFTSYFSTSQYIPLVVTYWLTPQMVNCNNPKPRTNDCGPDPDLNQFTQLNKDYKKPWDKGHNMSAEDNGCSGDLAMHQCFYFTNMTPQTHHLNSGVWKSLEKQEQDSAANGLRMFIYVGSIGKLTTIGIDQVVVPEFMWKLIYYQDKHMYDSYLFPNTNTTTQPYTQYKVTFAVLQQKTGLSFNGQFFKWPN